MSGSCTENFSAITFCMMFETYHQAILLSRMTYLVLFTNTTRPETTLLFNTKWENKDRIALWQNCSMPSKALSVRKVCNPSSLENLDMMPLYECPLSIQTLGKGSSLCHLWFQVFSIILICYSYTSWGHSHIITIRLNQI